MRIEKSALHAIAVLVVAGGVTAASADVELTFRFNDPDVDALRASLDEFEGANPGIKVTLERIAWGDAREQFLREAAVGEGPDVAQIAFVWPRSMGIAGALMTLNELIERDGIGKGWDDFVATDLADREDPLGQRFEAFRQVRRPREPVVHLDIDVGVVIAPPRRPVAAVP